MDQYINAPLSREDAAKLKSGDYVYITGTIYTARDAAHKRLYESLIQGNEIPFELENNIIYYLIFSFSFVSMIGVPKLLKSYFSKDSLNIDSTRTGTLLVNQIS